MGFPSNTIAVDWSLIEIWCCGKFYSSVDISAHTELCHANNKASSGQVKSRSTRSGSFPQKVGGNQFSKPVEASGISTENSSVQMGNIGFDEDGQGGDIEMRSPKRRILSERKSKIKAEVELANTSRGDISDLKNLFDDDKYVDCDREITRKIFDNKQDEFSNEDVLNKPSKEFGTQHIKKRTGEKPYSCPECDKKYKHRIGLWRHKRIHSGEKPHVCEICDYKSIEASKLMIHMRTHSGQKPFACEECDYKCTNAFGLKRHIRIHTGEKPYQCKICEASFAQLDTLKFHTKSIHQKKHCKKS